MLSGEGRQTLGVVSTPETRPEAGQFAAELGECRQRGLDRLDVDTPPQAPIKAEEIERLAREYCTRTAPELHGRIACIKRLLRDALAAYGARGNQADAELITTLFFGEATTSRSMNASEMLKLAMNKHGVSDEKKFREDRRRALGKFAEFLPVFVLETHTPPGRRRHAPMVAVLGFVVLAVLGVGVWLSSRGPDSPTGPEDGGTVSPVQTTVSSPPFVQGKTFTQTVHSPKGARTYTDPHNLVGEGDRVPNGRNVQVSCKIVAPGDRSVGVYWYRITSPPWNNHYYSPANSWLNNDPPTGPYTSIVDPTVPYCPD